VKEFTFSQVSGGLTEPDGIIACVPVSQWKNALSRTRRMALAKLGSLLGTSELDESFWEILEACLIQADAGVESAGTIIEDLRIRAGSEGWQAGQQALDALRGSLVDRVSLSTDESQSGFSPEVVLLVGVNGSGKTTSAAKLAYRLTRRGQSVLLAAADTFRAAGAEQLERWGERLNLDVIRGADGSDPAAIAYQAIERGLNQAADAVVIDTSGRMHTSHNLMAELEKIVRVAGKALPGAPHRILIVLDATTGQNGVDQAKAFRQVVPVNGVILAKLDSSAKGGMGLAVAEKLGLPISYVGVGEGPDDLVPFDPEAYVDGLLADLPPMSNQKEVPAGSMARLGGSK
jgi:fused signal recognition particle receptor